MSQPDKSRVLTAFDRSLRSELATLASITAAARDEATSAESRPENKYDTRATEASYLAAGQGERLEALNRLVGWFAQQAGQPCTIATEGALLSVRLEGGSRWILLAPRGGPEVVVDDVAVQLISVGSPLGRALTGLAEGDVAEIESPRGLQEVEVEVVR